MLVWLHRPRFLHLALFSLAYFLGCGFAQALAILPETGVSIWPPAGIFIATLILTSRYSWPWRVPSGCLAEMIAQLLRFHSPLPAGLPIFAGNALGAAAGATLLKPTFERPVRLEILREVLASVVLGAGVAPLVSARITAERIIRDANSAADVVSRICALFKQSIEARNSTVLGSAIAEALDLMADEAALRRVRNGSEAMDAATEDHRVLGICLRRLGEVVQAEIRGRGPGVAFSDRIFEPFFTTKGNGMGMGLTICRSIAESHGGRLWAGKDERQGALFVFSLPFEPKAAP